MLGILRHVQASRSGSAGLQRLAALRCNSTVAESEARGPNVPLEEYLWAKADWYKEADLTAPQAAKILRRRLEEYGPQRELQLAEVVKRVQTGNDTSPLMKALEDFRAHRAARQQHSTLSPTLSNFIIKRLVRAGAAEKASEVLADQNRLGLAFNNLNAYEDLIIHYSKKGELDECIRVFNLLKAADRKISNRFVYSFIRSFRDNGRMDLAEAYIKEFELNGFVIRPALKRHLDAWAAEPAVSREGGESGETAVGQGGKHGSGEGGEIAEGGDVEDAGGEGGESGETPSGEGVELAEGDAGIKPEKLPPGSVPS